MNRTYKNQFSGMEPAPGLGLGSRLLVFCRYLFFCLLLMTGCNPIIDITGTLLTRLTSPVNKSSSLLIVAKDQQGENIEGFQISIIRSADSVLVFPTKFTLNSGPVVFDFPEECINDLDSENGQLLIILYHPDAGLYCESISSPVVTDSVFYFKEIQTGFTGRSLPKLSLQNTKNFRMY